MKRLRLIKPWRLRTLPQRLTNTSFEPVLPAAVQCAGPRALDEESRALRDAGLDVRFADSALHHRTAAPAPRAIFAPVTNERFRP